MKNFKKDVEDQLYQDLLRNYKSKLKVKPEPGQDRYRTSRYTDKVQLDLF